MKLSNSLTLTDIIDVETLINIQDKLAKFIDIPVVTVDTDGVPVGNQSNFTPFCQLIRSSKKGASECINCDMHAGILAVQERKPRIYDCHMGLKDCVAPIMVNNQFLGSVLGGQVLIKGKQTRDDIDIENISKQFDIPIKELSEVVQHIPLVPQEYLENCFDFYNFLANYITQIGVHRLTQDQLLLKSQEKLKLEQQAKKMELKTIEAQINPHFLFNTLNSIARLALLEDAPQTEELIYNLSDLLRYNLKNIEEFPKLEAEINNIKKYLFIQTLRYSDRISYEIALDNSLLQYRIPSMILQPIVENAIIHGLETKVDGGKIKINGIKTTDNNLQIIVRDDGLGFKKELLKLINPLTISSSKNIGIGISNTHDRIKHYFGNNFGLRIESIPNVETSVTITIPCFKDYPSLSFKKEGMKIV